MAKRLGTNKSKKLQARKEKLAKLHIGRYVMIVFAIAILYQPSKMLVKKINISEKIKPFISMHSVTIKGCKNLDSTKIYELLELDSTITILSKDRERIKKEVLHYPGVESVKLNNALSKKLVITVKERKPIGISIYDNTPVFIDSLGAVWDFQNGKYWELPVVTGLKIESDSLSGNLTVSSKELKRFMDIYNTFNGVKENPPIRYDLSDKDMITIKFNGLEPMVRFSSNRKHRVENMRGVIYKLQSSDITAKEYIDLSYNNVAFIR